MADLNAKIIPLQTEVLGRVPTDAQIDVGEIAINLTDRQIFSKNSAGEIVTLGGGLPEGDFEPNYPPDGDDPIPLKEGDALRYDGSAWRAVDYKLEALDDVDPLLAAPVAIKWTSETVSSSSGGMLPGEVYLDDSNFGVHPEAVIDGQSVSVQLDFENWLAFNSEFDNFPNRDGGSYIFSPPIDTTLSYDGEFHNVSITKFINNGASAGAYRPRLMLHWTRPEGVADVEGKIVRLPEFEEFYANQGYESRENSVLQYRTSTRKWTAGALVYELRKAVDFAYQQAPPVTPGWASGDSQNPAEYVGDATTWIFNLQAIGGADRSQLFADNADTASVWWSADGSSFTEEAIVGVTQTATTATILFAVAPAPPTTAYIAFSEPGVPTDVPIRAGDILVWNGTDFVPGDPTGSLDLSLDDLTDVNTITFPPSAGQALVWDESNSIWRPGSVASDNDTALNDLTDVTVTSPASGQVIKYTGSGFENAALDYSEIANAPDGVSAIGDLSDVDVSNAPVIGQVLVWDGAAWKPADQSGGEGGGGTITGALTERADITTGVTLAAGVQGDLLFAGLGEAGSFVQVTTNVPAWVRFYPTAGLRAGDVTRQIDEDPAPGSGVLLELRTQTANQTLVITPGAIYYNNDTLPDQALYCRVQNQGDATALVNVTVRAFTQTDTDTISGGTFGSG